MSLRVVILNTCSTLNRGDAAIVLAQIRLLREHCPTTHIAITSRTPALDRPFYEAMGVEVLAPLTPALSVFRGYKDKVVGCARSLAAWDEKRRLIRALRHSDLVLACGGGYFHSYRQTLPGTTFWQNVIHAHLAAALNRPLAFLPQSFGPFRSRLALRGMKAVLSTANVVRIFVRERVSQRLLHAALGEEHHPRIRLCPDMAFHLAARVDARGRDRSADLRPPVLLMTLREWQFPETRDAASGRRQRTAYLDTLVDVARYFLSCYRGSVVVIPQALGPDPAEDDRPICREFYQRVQRCLPANSLVQFREPGTDTLTGYLRLLSQAEVLIGTRLHSCILALVSGVPAVSIGYQHKSQGTMDMVGLGRFNTHISEVSSDWLLGSVDQIMRHRDEIRDEIGRGLCRVRTDIHHQVGSLLRSFATTASPAPPQNGAEVPTGGERASR